MKQIVFVLLLGFYWVQAQNITWTGSVSSDWGDPNNWSPMGPPTGTSDVIINNGAAPNMPVLNMATNINSLVISAGTLDLNGLTLTINGNKNSSFSGGMVSNGILDFNTVMTVTFSGTFTSNANISGSVGIIRFNGGTFNNPITLTKTSATGAYSTGGATFNAPLSLTNTSNALVRLGSTNPDTYNAPIILNNTGTSYIQVAYNGSTTFNNDVTAIASNGSVRFGSNVATNVLFNNNAIDVSGVTSSVFFEKCTFTHGALTLSLGANGTFNIITSTVAGSFTLNTSRFLSNTTTYNGAFTLNRNNTTLADNSYGGNIFNSDLTVNLSGSVGGRFANTNGDTYNGNLNINNNSTATFTFAFNGANNLNQNLNIINNTTGAIVVGASGTVNILGTPNLTNNSTGTIRFSQNATAIVTFNQTIQADNNGGGNVIFGNSGTTTWNTGVTLNATNFTNGGSLQLHNVNQTDNTVNNTINLPNATLTILNSTWNGQVDFTATTLTTSTSTYQNTTSLNITGAGTSSSNGGNTFNGSTTITNNGTGTVRFAAVAGDDFNNTVNFVRNSGTLVPVYNASSTFASDVTVTSATTINMNGLSPSNAVFDGAGAMTLTASSGTNLFRNMTINTMSGKVVMNNDVQINNAGTLTISDGVLDLNGKILKVSNPMGAAITRTNGGILCESDITGARVEWSINNNTDNHIVPFINAMNEYVPFEVQLTAGDVGVLSVATYKTAMADNMPYPAGVTDLLDNSAHNNSLYVVDRFTIVNTTGTSYMANVVFGYGDSEIQMPNLLNENFLKAQRWNGTRWEDPIGNVNVAMNVVSVTGITQFSPWTIADASEPLPVQFLNFDALAKGLFVELSWTTNFERNNHYFEIERSIDAISFKPLGKVMGTNQNIPVTYNHVDYAPIKGINYYRIKQVDYNGNVSYSDVKAVKFDKAFIGVSFAPNPASTQITFDLSQTNLQEIPVYITNALGQTVWQQNLYPTKYSNFAIDISQWTKGIYFVHVKSESSIQSSKLIVE